MELDEWKNASKKRIEKMTFDEARKILENQIRLGKEGGQWCLANTLLTPTRWFLNEPSLMKNCEACMKI